MKKNVMHIEKNVKRREFRFRKIIFCRLFFFLLGKNKMNAFIEKYFTELAEENKKKFKKVMIAYYGNEDEENEDNDYEGGEVIFAVPTNKLFDDLEDLEDLDEGTALWDSFKSLANEPRPVEYFTGIHGIKREMNDTRPGRYGIRTISDDEIKLFIPGPGIEVYDDIKKMISDATDKKGMWKDSLDDENRSDGIDPMSQSTDGLKWSEYRRAFKFAADAIESGDLSSLWQDAEKAAVVNTVLENWKTHRRVLGDLRDTLEEENGGYRSELSDDNIDFFEYFMRSIEERKPRKRFLESDEDSEPEKKKIKK